MSDNPSPEDLPPAYFLSLTLENVRCFGPEQTLDLTNDEGQPAQWTVLLGDNGTGKTTLLQVVAGMEPVAKNLKGAQIDYGSRVVTKGFASGGLEELLELGSHPSELSISCQIYHGSKLKDPDFGKGSQNSFWLESGPRSSQFHSPDYQDPSALTGLCCFGYGAGRKMAKRAPEEDDEVGTKSLFDEEVELPNAEEWLLQTDYAAKSGKKKAKKRRGQIETVLAHSDSGILPDVDDLEFVDQEGDTSPPRVEFRTPYGWVTIDQLSLGYRTMIAWVVDLARRLFERYPESDNPLAEPAVCLVDEIDLHLHPKWQRKIIDFLSERFPNTQFIVTAHSPLVVQAAQEANIALLKRVENPDGDDYVEIHNDMEPVGNLRVDQILTSDLYGLESARPPHLDSLLEERQEILSQSELTEGDENRLDEIEEEVGDLPSGETKEQREAMDFIKDVADRLETEEEATS